MSKVDPAVTAKSPNSEPQRSAICQACLADQGFCVYCQHTWQRPMSLHRHIEKNHPDTIRAMECDD